jgi:hypothetical protein
MGMPVNSVIKTVMNNIEVVGLVTEYYFFPEEMAYLSHGLFAITNKTTSEKHFIVKKCELREDDNSINIEGFHVSMEGSATGSSITVPSESSRHFRVSFPFYPVNVRKADKYSLKIFLGSGKDTYEAVSVISVFFERKA